jgi:hypothetical protein
MNWKNYINELIGIPLVFLLFWFSPIVLRWLDPTAGVYDAGVLQSLIVAAIFLLTSHTLSNGGLAVVFPKVFKYFNNDYGFNKEFEKLTEWQRIRLSLFLYCFFMAVFVAALIAI